MSEEVKKPGRKPATPAIKNVVSAIERGEYDSDLIDLKRAIESRNSHLQAQVLELVHQVFGENATVSTPRGTAKPASSDKGNPFLKRAAENADQAGHESEDSWAPNDDDPLAHLDEVEQKMTEDGISESPEAAPRQEVPVPLEQRGATISGLHSSDIAG